uniref:RNA-dependent RNA polymerase n=1 Tax=Ingleside virus TaxID=2485871 RepID=A0A3G3BTQ0_9VIRU|nr:RNA-dependent RNA polymerase [Ingleside virus]UJQ88144.1 MAG: RNA-dependent RNA polymerase [Ingleside virus]UJQ88146.1 MAG: RNA-dependent RNA polymerase [Ingleside virus]UJQ88152.1 MAG: RNA-dependent RNA polymerase [Ingleside virus]UJQ88154.1 MAG: RNA-dependent RNA polymerase [Ingleside virus]
MAVWFYSLLLYLPSYVLTPVLMPTRAHPSAPAVADAVVLPSVVYQKGFESALRAAESGVGVDARLVTLHEDLSTADQQALSENFPEYHLKFTNTVKHAHPYPAAARKLETRLLLSRVGYTPGLSSPAGSDVVCDVGGDFSYHLFAGNVGVHSCDPILCARDIQRSVGRRERVYRAAQRGGQTPLVSRFLDFGCEDASWTCDSPAQHCDRFARYGIAVHSTYDIPLPVLGDIMTRKHMTELYGSFIFSDELLHSQEAVLDKLRCFVQRDVKADSITFTFQDDLSLAYTHKLSVYLSYLTVTQFHDSRRCCSYLLELLENRGGLQFFKVTSLHSFVPLDHSPVTHLLWFPSLRGKTLVRFFEIDHDKYSAGLYEESFTPVSFYVNSDVVNQVMVHALACTETKFRPVEIFNFLNSYTGRIFFGSDVSVRHRPLPAHDAYLLANAIYIACYVKKYDVGRVVQGVLGSIQHNRRLEHSGFLARVFGGGYDVGAATGAPSSTFLQTLCRTLHFLLYRWKRDPLACTAFLEEAVCFQDCSQAADSLLVRYIPRCCAGDSFSREYPVTLPMADRSPEVLAMVHDALAAAHGDDYDLHVTTRLAQQGRLSVTTMATALAAVPGAPEHIRARLERVHYPCDLDFASSGPHALVHRPLPVGDYRHSLLVLDDGALCVDTAFSAARAYRRPLLFTYLDDVYSPSVDRVATRCPGSSADAEALFARLYRMVSVRGFSGLILSFSRYTESLLAVVRTVLERLPHLPVWLYIGTHTDPDFLAFCATHIVSTAGGRVFGSFSRVGLSSEVDVERNVLAITREARPLAYTAGPSAVALTPDTDPFVDVSTDLSRAYLRTLASGLGHLDPADFSSARDRADPGSCGAHPYLSRAALKLADIWDELEPPTPGTDYVALDLCAAPGGFTQYMLERPDGPTLVYVASIATGPVVAPVLLEDPRVSVPSFGGRDLTDASARAALVEGLLFSDISLVTADGGFFTDSSHGDRELRHLRLFRAQCAVACQVLVPGGAFVCKFFDGALLATRHTLAAIACLFERVLIVKPESSRPANAELYLVAVGFRPCPYWCNWVTTSCDFLECVPLIGGVFLQYLVSVTQAVQTFYRRRLGAMVDLLRFAAFPALARRGSGREVVRTYYPRPSPLADCHSSPASTILPVESCGAGTTCGDDAGSFVSAPGCTSDSGPLSALCVASGEGTAVFPPLSSALSVDSAPPCVALGPLSSSSAGTQLLAAPVCEPSSGESRAFRGDRFFLSNFYPSDLYYEGLVFPTAEHAFQAAKAPTGDLREAVRAAPTPRAAKNIARQFPLPDGWEARRLEVMAAILSLKFAASTDLAARLVATGTDHLVERNTWHDNYWGDCLCSKCSRRPGLNHLGVLLMRQRDTLQCGVPLASFAEQPYAVPGDGDCLFHTLSLGYTERSVALRAALRGLAPGAVHSDGFSEDHLLEETRAPGVMAGRSTIVAYAQLYDVRVTIEDPAGVVLMCEGPPGAAAQLRAQFDGVHYSPYLPVCDRSAPRPRPLPVLPLDRRCLEAVVVALSVPGAPLHGIGGFRYWTRGSASAGGVYSQFANLCHCHTGACLDAFGTFIDEFSASGEPVTLAIFLMDSADFVGLRSVMAAASLAWTVLVVPGFAARGYLLVAISRVGAVPDAALTDSVGFVKSHMASCGGCSRLGHLGAPHAVDDLATVYYCRDLQADGVFYVPDPAAAAVEAVYRLLPVESDAVMTLLDRDDGVLVPVPFSSPSVLDVDDVYLAGLYGRVRDFAARRCLGGPVALLHPGFVDISPVATVLRRFHSAVYVSDQTIVTRSYGVDFSPAYLPAADSRAYIYNSMVEAREYYAAAVGAVRNRMHRLHHQHLAVLAAVSADRACEVHSDALDFGMIDLADARYVVRPKSALSAHQCAYDGSALLDLTPALIPMSTEDFGAVADVRQWLRPSVLRGLVSVSKDTRLLNSLKIHSVLTEHSISLDCFRATVEMVEGVPGCGKTHYIIENHEFSTADTYHTVLTSSREAARDLRRRVACRFGVDGNLPILRYRYRTIDSFLMNYHRQRTPVDVLWIDEALMRHYGDILWCAYICSASRVVLFGDRAQIPFINRVAGVVPRFHELRLRESDITFLANTRRCPVDVAALLHTLALYPAQVTSSSAVRRSLRVMPINGVADVLSAAFSHCQLLVFTQGEKADLLRAAGRSVFTVNEFQGNQAEHVLLVRLNPKPVPVFESQPHILVAVSRHTESFLYATVVADVCTSLVATVFSERDLDSATCADRFLGGGYHCGPQVFGQHPYSTVRVVPPVPIDYVKHNRVLRDFVQNHGGTSYAPLRVLSTPIYTPLVSMPECPPYYVSDPVTTIQRFYDIVFPGDSLSSTRSDPVLYELDDLHLPSARDVRFNVLAAAPPPSWDTLRPVLRTAVPPRARTTLKQVLKAYFDRNGSVPELSGIVADDLMAENLYSKFVRTYVERDDVFSLYEGNPVDINVDSIEEWLYTQPPGTAEAAFDTDYWNIFYRELNRFSYILKALPKPKLALGAAFKFPSPQTIAHQTKDVNAVFCPIVRELKRRLIAVLRSNHIVYSDMSPSDFETLLSGRFPPSAVAAFPHMLEVDISKYDKSQGRLALKFEVAMLVALGMPRRLVPVWIYMHVRSRVDEMFTRFSATVDYQRRSGDSMTFFGNTLFLMATLADTFELRDALAMFSGDDSLIFSPAPLDRSRASDTLAISFNLESKLLEYSTPYFCSKFLVALPCDRWVVVPDVMKVVIKLGRHDLQALHLVEEYRRSCADLLQPLSNSYIYPALDQCVIERYKVPLTSLSSLYSALHHLVTDPKMFASLYYSAPQDALNPYIKGLTLGQF